MTTELNSHAWWVNVGGKSYGPYGACDMARFIAEGRLHGGSQVGSAPAGAWRPAREVAELSALLYPMGRSLDVAQAAPGEANMLVYLEQNGARRLTEHLASLGAFTEISPSLMLLRTTAPVSRVRTALAAAMGPYDRLLVIDATRHRAAWHNLGPEAEASFRALWNAPAPVNDA